MINLQEKSTRNKIRPQICQASMDEILLSANLLDSSALFQLYKTRERQFSFHDFLLRFSQTCKFWSSKAALAIAFLAAVNHNYDHK